MGRGGIDKPVNPNGYPGIPDPWVIAGGSESIKLWTFDFANQQSIQPAIDATITDMTGLITADIPAGTFNETVTLELTRGREIDEAFLEGMVGRTPFTLLKVGLNNMAGLENIRDSLRLNSLSTPNDITLIINYEDLDFSHLNENGLGFYRWDDLQQLWISIATSHDPIQNIIIGQTNQLGYYNLQTPILCANDPNIQDDDFFGASSLTTNDMSLHRVFDIAEDEDWFTFHAAEGVKYTFETLNLATNVDTKIELFDMDGISMLSSDDNGGIGTASRLEWISPSTGVHYIRLSRVGDSAFGCNAVYDLRMSATHLLFLPVIN